MHLISPLAAGMRGCEGGTVGIYRRGTGTRATYYTSFEGDGSTTPVADVALDSNGRLEVYVNEVVDCVCKNSAGSTILTFTDGVSASCVEYMGTGFTGQAYSGGATGINKPVNLKAILDLWATSSGSTDFGVGASDTPLEDAVTAVEGVFYNVLAYGATGDGVTDDRAAIVAADAAAAAAGGGTLFFPPGTYVIGSSFTMTSTTSWQGAGDGVTHVTLSDASSTLTLRGFVADISFENTTNLSGPLVTAGSGGIRAFRCRFGKTGNAQPSAAALVSMTSSTNYVFDGCAFRPHGSNATALLVSSASVTMLVVASRFEAAGGALLGTPLIDGNSQSGLQATITGCVIGAAGSWGGGSDVIFDCDFSTSTAQMWSVSGCVIGHGAGVTFNIVGDDDAQLHESGNVWVTSGTALPYALASGAWGTGYYALGIRKTLRKSYSDNSAALTIDNLTYGSIVVVRTNATAQTVTFKDAPVGAETGFLYHNNWGTGGGVTTLDTTRVDMLAASNQVTLAADTYRYWKFRSEYFDSKLRQIEISLASADEPE